MLLALLFVVASLLPAPPGYERAVSLVPARHWGLVRSTHLDREHGAQARRATMSIHLVPKPEGRDASLVHEVGHVVQYADPALERDWTAQFGRGRTAKAARESFADAYAALILTGCPDSRAQERFLRERVFRPGEYPCHENAP